MLGSRDGKGGKANFTPLSSIKIIRNPTLDYPVRKGEGNFCFGELKRTYEPGEIFIREPGSKTKGENNMGNEALSSLLT